MSNYNGLGRSNYVKFTDLEKVKAIAKFYGLTLIDATDESGAQRYGFTAQDTDDGQPINFVQLDAEDEDFYEKKAMLATLGVEYDEFGEDDQIDLPEFLDVIAPYIVDGEVLVWMQVGSEKHRYFMGFAVAINNKGQRRDIDLEQIYVIGAELGTIPSNASY